MAIHTKDIMDDSFVATVKNAKIGEEQFCLFVKERFIDRSKPVTNPLKKNNLPAYLVLQLRRLCWKTRQNSNCRKRTAVHCLSNPWRKPGWVFFVWKSTLDTIFFRPRTAARRTKNRLLKCLPQATAPVSTPPVDAVILDGVVIVQMLEPKKLRTFDKYFSIVFAPYVLKQLENAKRVDLVWDVYLDDSLKKSLWEKRGAGQRRKVVGSTRIPSDSMYRFRMFACFVNTYHSNRSTGYVH